MCCSGALRGGIPLADQRRVIMSFLWLIGQENLWLITQWLLAGLFEP